MPSALVKKTNTTIGTPSLFVAPPDRAKLSKATQTNKNTLTTFIANNTKRTRCDHVYCVNHTTENA
jgi:hypothetical protein